MKDFDTARQERAQADRGFLIGGEQFIRRASVRPEATKPWEDVDLTTSHDATLAAIDETVTNMIEPGAKGEAHKRWAKLREREDDAISLGDLLDLVQWLVQEQAARPTVPPSNSSDEPEDSGTSSTGGSSSPATPAASTV